VFLALRLKSDQTSGDIQPILLKYALTGEGLATTPVAAIPLRLTSVSATDYMPMKVFALGPSRAEPINYAEVMMDLTKADWLGCDGSQECYHADHVLRVRDSLGLLASRGFVTDFAGPTEGLADLIPPLVNVNQTSYESLDAVGFLLQLVNDNIPSIPLVQTIIERYIPNTYLDDGLACTGSAYQPESGGAMEICLTMLEKVVGFDAVALYEELDRLVFQPAIEAQAWFNSHDYLTHLYGEFASVQDMKNDPYFAFDRMLPDHGNEYNALATPVCDDQGTVGLEIEIQNPGGSTGTSMLPAQLSCGEWYRTDPEQPLFGTPGLDSAATQLVARSFNGDGTTVIFPYNDGQFVEHEVEILLKKLDSHAPNQSIPSIDDDDDDGDTGGTESSSAATTRTTTRSSIVLAWTTTMMMVIPSLLVR
jgi:Uncharacterized protein conserved in bacteria (DUF2330)